MSNDTFTTAAPGTVGLFTDNGPELLPIAGYRIDPFGKLQVIAYRDLVEPQGDEPLAVFETRNAAIAALEPYISLPVAETMELLTKRLAERLVEHFTPIAAHLADMAKAVA